MLGGNGDNELSFLSNNYRHQLCLDEASTAFFPVSGFVFFHLSLSHYLAINSHTYRHIVPVEPPSVGKWLLPVCLKSSLLRLSKCLHVLTRLNLSISVKQKSCRSSLSLSEYLLVLLVPCAHSPSLLPRASLSQNDSQIVFRQREVNSWGLSLMNGL